ncbi:hypothetical protein LEP3755_64280 (plasmid) [Leptolyngbya sp. NIES-3755]|nr:hypothetical protein LEP3755_64280 [Leptolyngbya sp. NIES-3755]
MNFRQNDIIFLLGAGASVDAGIPASVHMINDLETLLLEHEDWELHKKLYDFVKSSILHGDGINGVFGRDVNYNIERLVCALSELELNEHHILFPFITGWMPKLVDLAGTDFKRITELKRKIVGRLKESWILVESYDKANYYQGFINFQRQFQYPLRIFTLNYDLCVERACRRAQIERGFNEARMLDVKRFEDDQDQPVDIFLYKVHGSIDWKKDKYGSLTFSDEAGSVSIRELEIIFGTSQKLKYVDPYLFLIHEFRTLRLVLTGVQMRFVKKLLRSSIPRLLKLRRCLKQQSHLWKTNLNLST